MTTVHAAAPERESHRFRTAWTAGPWEKLCHCSRHYIY